MPESQSSQNLNQSHLYSSQRLPPKMETLLAPEPRDLPPIIKKRRGRQPRQSLLTSTLRAAIARFTTAVGAPVLQPAGFRDFNGWLHTIAQPSYKSAWLSLCHSFIIESQKVPTKSIPMLKRDVIHDIINNVVKRKSHESVKLVSTNARRQSCIPPSGNTVMTIFESYLATVSTSSVGHQQHQHQTNQSQHHHHHHHSHHHHQYSPNSSHNPSSRSSSYSRNHEKYHHSSGSSSTNTPYGYYSSSNSHQSRHSSRQQSSSTTLHSQSHNVSIASLSTSKSSKSYNSSMDSDNRATGGASTMDISALLIDDYSDNHMSRKGHHHSDRYTSSSTRSKLPSLSQLDEQLRERSEKERKF